MGLEPIGCRQYRLGLQSSLAFFRYPASEAGSTITKHELESLIAFFENYDPTWAPADLYQDALASDDYAPEARQYLKALVEALGIDPTQSSVCYE
jgi:hypothetical protein